MNKKAFTLIELLIVIGIIAILASGIIIAINPGRQFAQARDATRESHVRTLYNSLLSYQIDNNGSLSGLSLPSTSTEICNTNLETPDCSTDSLVDLSDLVDNDYINSLPVDPQGGVSADGTGYFVAEGSIILVAEKAETRFIGIGITKVDYECNGFVYSPNGSWGTKIDTTVRDYYTPADSTATVEKDIYCDDENCIFLADGVTAPSGDVCVAESEDVYLGLLWDKTDVGNYEYGSDGTLSDLGLDEGTHVSNLEVAVNNDTSSADKSWLSKDYSSETHTFPSMDACIAKGEGWRLPNIRELDSIRDQSNSAAPYTDLPNINNVYWSSSEASYNYTAAILDFYDGRTYFNSRGASEYIRCVRGQ